MTTGGGTVTARATAPCGFTAYDVCLQNNSGSGWSSSFACNHWEVISGPMAINSQAWSYGCGTAYRPVARKSGNAWVVGASSFFC